MSRVATVSGMGRQFRHGDVLIEEVESLPEVREKLPHAILAHGEVTGHCHRIRESGEADLYSTTNGFYLHVRADSVSLVHEEHRTISLTRGVFRVWRQREYSPQEIRVVRD